MTTGAIATLTARGSGVIRPAGGAAAVFFHHWVLEGVAFERLRPGDAVTYTLGSDRHWPDTRAATVRRAIVPPTHAMKG